MILQVENLKKQFTNQVIFSDLNLQVTAGEVVVIFGPSGVGKSVFLRCLNYLEKPTSGTVAINNKVTDHKQLTRSELLQHRRQMGFVFQDFSLFYNKSVLDNVRLSLKAAQKMAHEQATQRALSCLQQVGMQDYAQVYPKQLSGGQKQRVGIARALALQPPILLFDEPTSALDRVWVDEILTIIEQLAQAQQTMIIVTHELTFARRIAQRMIFMSDGEFVEQGTPQQILEDPQSEQLKKFLSTS